jgi:hypothetical protein
VIGSIRDAQIAAGVDRALVYDRTLYILAGFLVAGFLSNALVGPVAAKWLMRGDSTSHAGADVSKGQSFGIGIGGDRSPGAILTWLAVGLPIAWGVWQTLQSAVKIFR